MRSSHRANFLAVAAVAAATAVAGCGDVPGVVPVSSTYFDSSYDSSEIGYAAQFGPVPVVARGGQLDNPRNVQAVIAVANRNSNNVSVLLNTSEPDTTPPEQSLIDLIGTMGLPLGEATSLAAPLKEVLTLLTDGNPNNDVAACGKLSAFMNQVDAEQKSGSLTSAQAAQLTQLAGAIKTALGC